MPPALEFGFLASQDLRDALIELARRLR